jgi:signal transduction histidine kinase
MNANILIVDDTPNNLRLLEEMLSEQGYTVRAALNGPRALSTVQITPPDLILLDIKMPDMDGYEVCKQLKADERTRDISVIFISALQDVTDKVKGFSLGAVDYITKPFQPEEVLARVKTQLTLRNLQKGLQQEIARRRQAEEELRTLNQQLKEANQQLEETNQQLQEVNQQLQKANASKDKFFSIIAHELRNPFTALIGLTEAIVEEIEFYSKDQIKDKINRLHTNSERVYALLTNLLTWSRLERGLIECKPETFSLADVTERSIRLFASNAGRKQTTLRNLVPHGTTAYAEPKMIDTIIRNLISNALKFIEPGGTIEVSIPRQDEEFVEIAVSDTGIGMSQQQIEKLFRIEQKTSKKGTAGEEGTGLGLILCKELVEKNSGRIRVESEVGKGSQFMVSLPRRGTEDGEMGRAGDREDRR